MIPTEARNSDLSYRIYIRIWLLLLLLTAVLVLSGKLFHQALSVPAMLIVTPIKAGLVFFYFMHLKHERPLLIALVFLTLGLLVMVIGLLFFDISYR